MKTIRFGWIPAAAGIALGAAVESFDYDSGDLAGRDGGVGFAGPWTAAGALIVVPVSLTPSATPVAGYAAAGGAIETAAGTGENFDWVATRRLAEPLDLDSDATVYFSFLVRGDWNDLGVSRGFNVGFTGAEGKLTANAVTVKKDYNTVNLVAAVGGKNGADSIVGALADDTATFVAGKLIASAQDADTLCFTAYRVKLAGREAVPEAPVWTISADLGRLTGKLDYLIVQGRVNDAGMKYRFDEIRVGDSWRAVTGPAPRPAP